MQEKINKLLEAFKNDLAGARSLEDLESIRVKYLGKKGDITSLKKSIATLPNEEKPKAGKLINQASGQIEKALKEKNEEIKEELLKARVKEE